MNNERKTKQIYEARSERRRWGRLRKEWNNKQRNGIKSTPVQEMNKQPDSKRQ